MATQDDVRRIAIGVDELQELLTDGWRCQAPNALVEELDRLLGAP